MLFAKFSKNFCNILITNNLTFINTQKVVQND